MKYSLACLTLSDTNTKKGFYFAESGYKGAEMCPGAETDKTRVGCASDLQEAGEKVKAWLSVWIKAALGNCGLRKSLVKGILAWVIEEHDHIAVIYLNIFLVIYWQLVFEHAGISRIQPKWKPK
jgi:hypothetical protein